MELNYEETIRRIAEREKDDLDKYIDSFKAKPHKALAPKQEK